MRGTLFLTLLLSWRRNFGTILATSNLRQNEAKVIESRQLQFELDTIDENVTESSTCPPCPACSVDDNPIPQSEPLTVQILVVDSPGIITMGT